MQPKDRDEIIFRSRCDKKMQKLFTTLPNPTPNFNKNKKVKSKAFFILK